MRYPEFLTRRWFVFLTCWCLLFLLYLPAARSGWVADTTGWLEAIRGQSFADYLNRAGFGVRSFYQLTQLTTWIFYQIFGAHPWPWHLLHITLHALNCLLLYTLCRGLFMDAGVPRPALTAWAGVLLYAVSPYHSEVIVWEAAFHYLQGFLLILTVLHLLRRYLLLPKAAYALAAGILFALSTFSLELFYLTPWLCLSLILFYRWALDRQRSIVRRALVAFVLPQVLLFVGHLLLFRLVYRTGMAHLGSLPGLAPLTYYAIKPPDYSFHLLWGRFLPAAVREGVHAFFCTYAGAGLFYGAAALVLGYGIFRFRKGSPYFKLCSLLAAWTLLALVLVVPLWFPEKLLVFGDRYMYVLTAFFFPFLTLLLSRVRYLWVKGGLWAAAFALNVGLTFWLSRLWEQSTDIMDAVQTSPLVASGKTTLLLSNGATYKGVLMIGATPQGEFALRHDLLYGPPLPNRVIDVAAFNFNTPADGAHVRVMNDSVVEVGLNGPGSWWWYGIDSLKSYERPEYRVEALDGQRYRLTLKGDPRQYLLLYQVGETLKKVDERVMGMGQD